MKLIVYILENNITNINYDAENIGPYFTVKNITGDVAKKAAIISKLGLNVAHTDNGSIHKK